MIWSKLTRRVYNSPLPDLKSLRHPCVVSRFRCNFQEWLSSAILSIRPGLLCNATHSISGLQFGHEFSTKYLKQGHLPSSHTYPYAISCSSMLSMQRHYSEKKSRKMLIYLTTLVFAMVGSTYADVPLYRRFCQSTGYGGTIQRRESVEEKIARYSQDNTDTTRKIVVQFNADVSDGMQWKFVPTQRELLTYPLCYF